MPVVIETEDENIHMLAIVEKLMKKGEVHSAEEETLLKLLVRLIEISSKNTISLKRLSLWKFYIT
jgi:hypothetical protein